jgi:mono/diheme cytochrome c family protein
MKGFVFGIFTMILIFALGLLFAYTGFIDMRADNPPSKIEASVAGHAMDANVARTAPKLTNPVAANDANLAAGAHLYHDHCAHCHGDPVNPKGPLAESLNPPAPQFMTDAADMPESQNFYIVQHGIRWTGMPGMKTTLSEQQTWELVTFLSHMNTLPAAAKLVFAETAARAQQSFNSN